MSDLEKVLKGAMLAVVPNPSEVSTVTDVAETTLAKVRKSAARFSQTRGALLGGSFAKGTWIREHVDLDIFILFDPSTPDQEFERIGLEIGAVATRGHPRGKKYAQHPYTEAIVDGIRVNIVPCFDVKKGEWRSAADRSPFHVELVKGLDEKRKNQVRLLKAFMNGVGVYGAEIQRQGFSGYVAEVLVMKFGGLADVLQWFAGFEPENEKVCFSLPDPVDEGRDLGIAVSRESLARMILASRGFLSRPRLAFFGKMSGKRHDSLGPEVFGVLFTHKLLSEDTLWGELRRTTRHIVRHLEVLGFSIARSMAASDNRQKSAILLIPIITSLPPSEQRVGPTVDRRKDVESFLSANASRSRLNWVDDEARIRILVPRRHTQLQKTLDQVVRGKSGPVGVSKELSSAMKKNGKVLSGPSLASAAAKADWLQDGIREITSDAIGAR